jgi:multicomponent Na+:H+ antiporter subunit E
MITESLCLVPGSTVIALEREERTLGLHLLSVPDLAAVERQRAEVLATEERVVRAFGSAADIAALDQEPGFPGRRPDRRTPP